MLREAAEIPVVVSAADMEDETFLLHFEKRHQDQMGALPEFVDTIHQQPETIRAYRVFHDRLHELYQVTEEHEHERQ